MLLIADRQKSLNYPTAQINLQIRNPEAYCTSLELVLLPMLHIT